MNKILEISKKENILIIEDAAQCINSYYNEMHLGTIGDIGAISFHESKNINCGEGGALLLRDDIFLKRAEILREKGTDRSSFFRGETDKYGWVGIGSSHLLSDILSAYLLAQLESIDDITSRRLAVWNRYYDELSDLKRLGVILPHIPSGCIHNGHIFYIVLRSPLERISFIEYMKKLNIPCLFHYQTLHNSTFYNKKYFGPELFNANMFCECLVRLPLHSFLKENEVSFVVDSVYKFFNI